jgi:homoserine kinase
MNLTTDDKLTVQVKGEGKGALPENYYNPAMIAAIKLFQTLEQAPAGLNMSCTNYIPLDAGLSAHVALIVGGLTGANNLLGNPLQREDLIGIAAELSGRPEAVITAMRGGLGLCSTGPEGAVYRTIEIAPLRVVVVLPTLTGYIRRQRSDLPTQVSLDDAVCNIGHSVLLVEALRAGDFKLLRHALYDRLHEPTRREMIPGYDAVVAAAKEAGAAGVTLCGAGPALIAFANYNHQVIEEAVQQAFKTAGVEVRTWTLGVDTQGVVISVVQ